MEQVNLGSLPDGTGGDSIRVGFQKCNDNFTEVAEQLKTAGVASAEELKQIKDAATALAERVEKLEKASGGGGGVPADELAALKQQLQQLQTKLTAAEQAASDAAGKAATAQKAASMAQQAAGSATQTANAAKPGGRVWSDYPCKASLCLHLRFVCGFMGNSRVHLSGRNLCVCHWILGDYDDLLFTVYSSLLRYQPPPIPTS